MALRSVLALASVLVPCVSGLLNGTVFLKNGRLEFVSGKSDPSGVAFGSFSSMDESPTGFGLLTIQSNKAGLYNDR